MSTFIKIFNNYKKKKYFLLIIYLGVTTMLNFFTTSNGFRSTLPVVSNLTAMNVWDGVCMCFIYASLLEFVCVNYVGRKRPLHNVVYRPGENPVTQVNFQLYSYFETLISLLFGVTKKLFFLVCIFLFFFFQLKKFNFNFHQNYSFMKLTITSITKNVFVVLYILPQK